MKRLAAIIISALLLFSFTACDFSNNTDETADETTESGLISTYTPSTEHDDAESDDNMDSDVSLDQAIFNSVSTLIDHDTLYNEEFPRCYNFINETTGYFFQFKFFGTQNRLVYLLKTEDGGKTWVAQDIQIVPTTSWREGIICAKMISESVGLISGRLFADENFSNRTYITTDKGKTWTKIVLPVDAPHIISERSSDLATYSEGVAYNLTHKNGVYFLHVRDTYYDPVLDDGVYEYYCYSSTDLINWTFVESTK